MFEPSNQLSGKDTPQGGNTDVFTMEALIEAMGCDDGLLRQDARAVLVARGFQATPALTSALETPNPNLRWEAARALREIGDPAAAPALVRALEDDGFDVRWIAAEALITLDQHALRPLLAALVQRTDAILLQQGAHHVLEALNRSHRLPAEVQPVLAALEGIEPAVTVPPAAQAALWALDGEAGPAGYELAGDVLQNAGDLQLPEARQLLIAMRGVVMCRDGAAGRCTRVIVDPAALRVSHLVVGNHERLAQPRMPRLAIEAREHPVVLRTPRLVLDENGHQPPFSPPHLAVEENEHQALFKVPHLVVEEDQAWPTEHLVPFDGVADATLHGISLDCTQQELAAMDDFIERYYREVSVPDYDAGSMMLMGKKVPETTKLVLVEKVRIPAHELALDLGTRVEATDGKVGQVDGLTVEPGSGRIMQLVLREGHLGGQKTVAVAAAQIDRIAEGTVYLKLDKQGVEAPAAS